MKTSGRGVSQIADPKAAATAAFHQETAQATAHTLRPIAVTHQVASTVARIASAIRIDLEKPDEVVPQGVDLATYIVTSIQQIEDLSRYSLTV